MFPPSKSIISSSRNEDLDLKIRDNELEIIQKTKYLGAQIDNSLNWKEHIKTVSTKASRAIGLLKHAKTSQQQETLKTLYIGIVEPHFRYCCSVWGCAGSTELNQLQKLQSRAARIIANSSFDTPSRPLINQLSWKTIERFIASESKITVFKSLYELAPKYLRDLFTRNSKCSSCVLRNSETDLRLPMKKSVRKGLPCNQSGFWVHKRCDKISDVDYDTYCRVPKNEVRYVCLSCKGKSTENLLDQLPFADFSFSELPTEELNTSDVHTNFDTRGLHFLHLNTNSLLAKTDEFRLIAQKTNAAVIGISETKLDQSVLDGEVNIDGHEMKRSDRDRHGGGVACYIRKDLVFNPREDFSPDIENAFFDIQLPKSKPILVGVLYRPPTTPGFLDRLTLAISKTTNFDSQEVYILGDLNINLLDKGTMTSNGIKRYKEFCSLHGLKQIIKSPTRITDKSTSLLDHILTNSPQKVSQHGVLGLGLSDHQLIYCTRKTTRIKRHPWGCRQGKNRPPKFALAIKVNHILR